MSKDLKNGIEVIQDPDPETVGDWIRDIGVDLGLCEREFTERLELRLNKEMRARLNEICKGEGFRDLAALTRRLYLEKIAKYEMRKEGHKYANKRKS